MPILALSQGAVHLWPDRIKPCEAGEIAVPANEIARMCEDHEAECAASESR